MAYENGLTHFDKSGQAIMVDVSEKKETSRTAIASGRIRVNRAVYEAIEQGTAKKGDVLGTARIAGIMAAKNTSAVIPLCHPLPIAKCSVDFTMLPEEWKSSSSTSIRRPAARAAFTCAPNRPKKKEQPNKRSDSPNKIGLPFHSKHYIIGNRWIE